MEEEIRGPIFLLCSNLFEYDSDAYAVTGKVSEFPKEPLPSQRKKK